MNRRKNFAILICIVAAILIFASGGYAADDVPRISKEELLAELDNPDLALLDARVVTDWRKSDKKIQGAVRVDPHDVSSWAGDYPKDGKIVVYCA